VKNITKKLMCNTDIGIAIKVPKMSDRISRDRNEVPVLVSATISQYWDECAAVQFEWGEESK
jgi:hypothetical protein